MSYMNMNKNVMNENQKLAFQELAEVLHEIWDIEDTMSRRMLTAAFRLSLSDKKRATPASVIDEYIAYDLKLQWAADSIRAQGLPPQDIPLAKKLLTELKQTFQEAVTPKDDRHYGWLGETGVHIQSRDRFPVYAQKIDRALKLLDL